MSTDGATPPSPNEIVNNDPCLRIVTNLAGEVEHRRTGDHDYVWKWLGLEMTSTLQCQTCGKEYVPEMLQP